MFPQGVGGVRPLSPGVLQVGAGGAHPNRWRRLQAACVGHALPKQTCSYLNEVSGLFIYQLSCALGGGADDQCVFFFHISGMKWVCAAFKCIPLWRMCWPQEGWLINNRLSNKLSHIPVQL